MVPKAFKWHAPTFVLFRFPPPHCQTAFLPLTFTQRVRRDSSLPLLPVAQFFWDLVGSLPTRLIQSVCSQCLSSLLHPRHFVSSDQPVSYNLFCTQPPSTSSCLVTCRCLSVHASFVFLRNIARIGSSHTPSFNSSHSCFAAQLASQAFLSRPPGKPLSCPLPPALRTAR